MRTVLLTVLAVAALAALPIAAAEGHEKPPEEEGYYVEVDAHPPRMPGAYRDDLDCRWHAADASSDRLWDYTLEQIQPRVDPEHPSLSGWTPTCVVVPFGTPGACLLVRCVPPVHLLEGHASYDVESGNYSFMAHGLPALQQLTTTVAFSGNSGVGIRFDCYSCPPPGSL